MQPLEQVRRSLDNWSPSELAALAEGARVAKDYCVQVDAGTVAGEDLFDLARVCALGLQWDAAEVAAAAYLKADARTNQARAYAIRINAQMNKKDLPRARELASAMLRTLPFDAEVDQVADFMVQDLAVSLDDSATHFAEERQPLLLAALAKDEVLQSTHGDTAIALPTLFEQAMELVYLEHYAGNKIAEQRSLAAIDEALSHVTGVRPEDERKIVAVRTQYALLGKQLPPLLFSSSLAGRDFKARINPDFGSATVLLLFPQWCAQCRQMMQHSLDFLRRNGDARIRAYGVMALSPYPPAIDPLKDGQFKDLLGTPTLTGPVADLESFGANAYPFAVITDGEGRIRFLGQAPTTAFDVGGFLEQRIDRVTSPPSALDTLPAATAAP